MITTTRATAFLTALLAAQTICAIAVSEDHLAEKVSAAVQDRQAFQDPGNVQLAGWVGSRVQANAANRLAIIDTDRLLEGYRKRPGRQSWDGEHVGKWLHAATLAWANTSDPALRKKLDYTVTELIKCQLPDGYLGTYLPKDRWTDWDVWAHKYNLIGLITYMRHTGNTKPLAACCRMADLLERTFGDTPGKRDIIQAGHHVGMAPTSVLEPMVLLYQITGEPRYLEFCKYLLRSWEQPNGPKIISTLLTAKRVDKVGNGKAYEMLSCLNGALEYYRVVGGDRQILDACINAWQDIVDKRLYLTGAASHGEHFNADFDLPNVANVGETCVTTTWIQFNAQLLRLTGEARFAEQLERVVLNQLFGAQRCDGSGWGYYVQMEGKKPYSSTLDGHCCLSSGPRGVALIPTFAISTDGDGVVVNLFETSQTRLKLTDGTAVRLVTTTQFPGDGRVRIEVHPQSKHRFALKVRMPGWSQQTLVKINGQPLETQSLETQSLETQSLETQSLETQSLETNPGADGYLALVREWADGDVVEMQLSLQPHVVVGDHLNAGKIALLYGPLVLAADEDLLGPGGKAISMVAVASSELSALHLTPEPAPKSSQTWPSAQVFRIDAVARKSSELLKTGSPMEIRLIPFADAGGTGSNYKVWLPLKGAAANGNVLVEGWESRSRQGNLAGSINDESPQSTVVTFDGRKAAEDWYAVALEEPTTIGRVVFVHGRNFPDGGWFDVSAGKPRVEIQSARDGDWQAVGTLEDYPATTATANGDIQAGQEFTLRLSEPARAIAVRVVGTPASGSNPQQAFSSCSELKAFAK